MSEPIYRIPPDWEATAVTTPLTERFDWSLTFLGIPAIWKQNRGQVNGRPTLTCVCDTGTTPNHPDLQGAILDAEDFTGSMYGPIDRVGHGSWCCGCIAARAENDIGVAGLAPGSGILSAKVLGDNGSGSDRSIEAGLKWGYDKGATFFSLSLGGPRMSNRLHGLIREISQEKNRFIFAASGNDGGPVNYPGAWDEVCGVGAVDKNGAITDFTSRGPELDILAPGSRMVSTVPDGYAEMTGTSMACPTACGVGVLAWSKHQEIGGASKLETIKEMIEHMQKASVAVGKWGLIVPSKLLAGIDKPATPTIPGLPPDTKWPFTFNVPAKCPKCGHEFPMFSVGLR